MEKSGKKRTKVNARKQSSGNKRTKFNAQLIQDVMHDASRTRLLSSSVAQNKTPHPSSIDIKHGESTFLDMMKEKERIDDDPIESDSPPTNHSKKKSIESNIQSKVKKSFLSHSHNKIDLTSILKKSRCMVDKSINTDECMDRDTQEGPDEEELSMRATVGSMEPRSSP